MDDRSRDNATNEACNEPSHTVGDEDIFRALSGFERIDEPEILQEIKAQIRRSIDDPRPSLSLDQVDAFIDTLVAGARVDGRRA